jgi:nucleoside triphosphate pyrophosphatase
VSAVLPHAAAPALILASSSAARAELLRNAGLAFSVEPAAIDEAEVKSAFQAERRTAADCASALAEAKAMRVARRHPGCLVIGADQLLVCEGTWFDKPGDRAAARSQLLALRGKPHDLVSAVCIVRDGKLLWHFVDRSTLTMRSFSEAFLEQYLDAAGADILASVGAYRLEGAGVQLFARVEGGHFAILGLPLLPLLEALRDRAVIAR